MATLRCKMCGGSLEATENSTVAECEYCGSVQTLPKLDDAKKVAMFDRANHYRSHSEFDKASVIYENIISEEPNDAEAHWGVCLCRYGIEYVEDPKTKKRIPTCHRTQFKSILDDSDYLAAIENADILAREVYQTEANYIDSVQKGILAISSKEEPFDIFICYKETDKDGERTTDSVIAQEIYTELTKEGYKVFFARITLEDKIGTAYEPYIFAALTSAKVMLVVGTKPEHFNAVWVKNEWSRYLSLVKQGQEKALVPCYRDMDAYDLPEEFVVLQGQDVSKIGWKQDLIRGVKKILPKYNDAGTTATATIETLTKRIFIFLEDEDWTSANTYCEKVLDIDPENAKAYLGKLMVDLRVNSQEMLSNLSKPFENNPNYKKILRFDSGALRDTVSGYNESIKTKNENALKESTLHSQTRRKTNKVIVSIPDYEMLGKIKGRDDKNLKFFEEITGVQTIILDSDLEISISGASSKKIEIAKATLEKLIAGGKIFPKQIEIVFEEENQKWHREHNESISNTQNALRTTSSIIDEKTLTKEIVLALLKTDIKKSGHGTKCLTLPVTYTKIGNGALQGIKELDMLIIPNSYVEIESNAFSWATIHQVKISDSVIQIGKNAFKGFTGVIECSVSSAIYNYAKKNNIRTLVK